MSLLQIHLHQYLLHLEWLLSIKIKHKSSNKYIFIFLLEQLVPLVIPIPDQLLFPWTLKKLKSSFINRKQNIHASKQANRGFVFRHHCYNNYENKGTKNMRLKHITTNEQANIKTIRFHEHRWRLMTFSFNWWRRCTTIRRYRYTITTMNRRMFVIYVLCNPWMSADIFQL